MELSLKVDMQTPTMLLQCDNNTTQNHILSYTVLCFRLYISDKPKIDLPWCHTQISKVLNNSKVLPCMNLQVDL